MNPDEKDENRKSNLSIIKLSINKNDLPCTCELDVRCTAELDEQRIRQNGHLFWHNSRLHG